MLRGRSNPCARHSEKERHRLQAFPVRHVDECTLHYAGARNAVSIRTRFRRVKALSSDKQEWNRGFTQRNFASDGLLFATRRGVFVFYQLF